MFTPENDLEQAMLQTAADSSAALAFYRHLLNSELIVLGANGERLAIDVIKRSEGFFHPIFTSPARLSAFSSENLPHFTLTGRTLFEATRGAQFIVNPHSSPAKTLFPDEIAWCLANFNTFNFVVLKPETYPTQLIKALSVLFANRTQLQTARLTFVGVPGNESTARIIVGIEADGDIARLAEEIFAAAAVANPGHPVDVASLDSAHPTHPLHQHLLTVAPFFERQWRLA